MSCEIWVDCDGIMWVRDSKKNSMEPYRAIPCKVGDEIEPSWVYMGEREEKKRGHEITKKDISLRSTFQTINDLREFERYIEKFSKGPRYPTFNNLTQCFSEDPPSTRPQSGRLPTEYEVRHMLKQPYFQLFCKFAAPRDEHGIIRIPTSDMDQWNSTRCLIVEVTNGKWNEITAYYQDIKVDRSVGQAVVDSPKLHCQPLLVLSVRDEKLPFKRGDDFVLCVS